MPNTTNQKLYMLLLGCRPKGRLTEQHDVFFGIAPSLKSLVPAINKFWPAGKTNLHVDAWQEVQFVDGYKITIRERALNETQNLNLFFVNLGGYQKDNFDELHHKLLIVAQIMEDAIAQAERTEFYKSVGFDEAISHVDNKYDVDEIINVKDVLFPGEFYIHIEKTTETKKDEINLGYFKLSEL